MDGSLSGTPVTVWGGTWGGVGARGETGGRVGGSGQFGQLVTVQYRGCVAPGAGMNSPGVLTFSDGLVAKDGSVFALDLSEDPSPASGENDRIEIVGDLSLSGEVAVVVNPLDGRLGAGDYTLLTYTGSVLGGVSNLDVDVPEGTPYSIEVGGGAVTLAVASTRAPAELVWRGSGSIWDLAQSQSWLRSGMPDGFVAGDSVTFDSQGASTRAVVLDTALPVGGVTVEASSNYSFSGSGSIAGSGGLEKLGEGTLTIETSNSYTGPTLIGGGTLVASSLADAGSPSSIGAASSDASNLVIDGGTLRVTGQQTSTNRSLMLDGAGGALDIASGASVQIGGTVTGAGMLTKMGGGTLLLTAANTYSGGTTIHGGKIYVGSEGNPDGLGSGTVTITDGILSMANTTSGSAENVLWNLVVPAGATARLEADGRCNLLGSLTGSGELTFDTPYVRTAIAGDWSDFSGRVRVVGDGEFRVASTSGFGAAAIHLTDGIDGLYQTSMSGDLAIGIGELAGDVGSSLSGGPSAGRTLNWEIGSRSSDSTYAGVIKDGTGPTAITKVGSGALTLAGANTYSGRTTVRGGDLLLAGGSLNGSNVVVSSGAAFGGSGSVSGNVSFAGNSTLLVDPTSGPLVVSGDMAFGANVTISPAPGAVLSEGSQVLFTYTGSLTGSTAFTWSGAGYTGVFDLSGAGQVRVTLTEQPRDPDDIVWAGDNSATWNTSAANWKWQEGLTVFQPGDRVRFDDSSAVTDVELSGSLEPESVAVDSTQNYLFSGAGSLMGPAAVTKSGSGVLELGTVQNHGGGTFINEGAINLVNSGGLGSGPLTLDGGTLMVGATLRNSVEVADGGGVFDAGSSNRTHTDALHGLGTLQIRSSAIFTLGDLSLFGGTLSMGMSSGTLRANSTGFVGGPEFTLDLGTGTASFLRSSSGPMVQIGALVGGASTLLNNAEVPTTYSIGAKSFDTVFSGSITGAASIEKVGQGVLTLDGSLTYTGRTDVLAGILRIRGSSAGGSSVSISPDGVLELTSEAELAIVGSIENRGTVRIYGDPSLTIAGDLVNFGTIDLINSDLDLPANVMNFGRIIRGDSVRVNGITLLGEVVAVSILSHPGHRYQLQRSESLAHDADWRIVGEAISGDGSVIQISDSDGVSEHRYRFFRVLVSPAVD